MHAIRQKELKILFNVYVFIFVSVIRSVLLCSSDLPKVRTFMHMPTMAFTHIYTTNSLPFHSMFVCAQFTFLCFLNTTCFCIIFYLGLFNHQKY